MVKKLRNLFEKRVYLQLKRAKVKFTYEKERIPYILCKHYIPDFIIDTPLGKIYIECKGYLRPEDRVKLIAVKKLNPHLDLRILFYAENKRNIRWANRNGFRFAIYVIPDDWYLGL